MEVGECERILYQANALAGLLALALHLCTSLRTDTSLPVPMREASCRQSALCRRRSRRSVRIVFYGILLLVLRFA